MARIKGKDIYLKDDDQIYFGDSQETALWYEDDDLRLNHTISGVDPTEDYHLTTRFYVDQEVDTLSGTIPYEHDLLIGLEDDDHLQYPRADGGVGDSRGFTSTVSGIDATEPYHLMTYQNMLDYLSGFDPTASGGVSASLTNFQYIVDLSSSQTTSTSYVTKLNLTASGIPAGNYRIGWSFEWRQSKTNASFWARVQDDTATLWEYEASPYVDVAFHYIVTNFYYLTLTSGTHVFDLDYRTSNSSCVSYIRSTKFEFWRIL